MMDVLNKIRKIVTKRNFNNDVLNTLDNMKRYRIDDKPINIGNSTFDGASLEYIIAITEVMQDMQDQLDAINKVLHDTFERMDNPEVISTDEISDEQLTLFDENGDVPQEEASTQCVANTSSGARCKNTAKDGSDYCGSHQPKDQE